MSRRQLAADVPELLEIVVLRILRGLDAERGVAARAAAIRDPVAQLLFHGQREELPEAAETLVDQALVDTVVLDDDEAVFLVRRGDALRELRTLRRPSIQCRNLVGHCGLLCLPPAGCRSRAMQAGNLGGKTAAAQSAGAVLMVRPSAFGFNAETASSNRFQTPGDTPDVAARARAEFDAFAAALASEGVTVCVADDSSAPAKPDAVFPNNWVSFHADGTLVLYPMQAQNRRLERRPEIIEGVKQQLGLKVSRVVDLTRYEAAGQFLEGTGSLVLDRCNRIAYACNSPRTHP